MARWACVAALQGVSRLIPKNTAIMSQMGLSTGTPRSWVRGVRAFPDTEPFVEADSRLLLTRQGLVVVRRQDLTLLRMT